MFYTNNESLIDFYSRIVSEKIKNYFIEPTTSQASQNGNELLSRFIKFFQFISLTGVVVVVSFMMGVIFSEVGDSFMDQSNTLHFGLKKNWDSLSGNADLKGTDGAIKIYVFNKS